MCCKTVGGLGGGKVVRDRFPTPLLCGTTIITTTTNNTIIIITTTTTITTTTITTTREVIGQLQVATAPRNITNLIQFIQPCNRLQAIINAKTIFLYRYRDRKNSNNTCRTHKRTESAFTPTRRMHAPREPVYHHRVTLTSQQTSTNDNEATASKHTKCTCFRPAGSVGAALRNASESGRAEK